MATVTLQVDDFAEMQAMFDVLLSVSTKIDPFYFSSSGGKEKVLDTLKSIIEQVKDASDESHWAVMRGVHMRCKCGLQGDHTVEGV